MPRERQNWTVGEDLALQEVVEQCKHPFPDENWQKLLPFCRVVEEIH